MLYISLDSHTFECISPNKHWDFFVVTAELCRWIRSSGGDIIHEWNSLVRQKLWILFMFPLLIPVVISYEWTNIFAFVVLARRSLSYFLSVWGIYDVWTSEKRLSLDTILNLNLPLLACKQGASTEKTTENRHRCSHLISHCTHTNTHTGRILWHIFLSFKAKQGTNCVCIVLQPAAAASSAWQAAQSESGRTSHFHFHKKSPRKSNPLLKTSWIII